MMEEKVVKKVVNEKTMTFFCDCCGTEMGTASYFEGINEPTVMPKQYLGVHVYIGSPVVLTKEGHFCDSCRKQERQRIVEFLKESGYTIDREKSTD